MKQILKNDELLSDYLKSISNDLLRVAYAYISDDFLVDEVISETIYKVYRYRKKVKKPEFLKTWITRILINECKKELKHQNKSLTLFEETIESGQNTEFDFIYEYIHQLNQPLQDIVLLKSIDKYTFSEIAEILEMNENTVKTDYYKAIRILRKDMEEVYE